MLGSRYEWQCHIPVDMHIEEVVSVPVQPQCVPSKENYPICYRYMNSNPSMSVPPDSFQGLDNLEQLYVPYFDVLICEHHK